MTRHTRTTFSALMFAALLAQLVGGSIGGRAPAIAVHQALRAVLA